MSPSLFILMFLMYPSTAYCNPFCLDLEDIAQVLLQKESLTRTAIFLHDTVLTLRRRQEACRASNGN